MLIESGNLLKNHVMLVVIYAKILHHSFIRTINENFNLSRANENLETCTQIWFDQLKKLK